MPPTAPRDRDFREQWADDAQRERERRAEHGHDRRELGHEDGHGDGRERECDALERDEDDFDPLRDRAGCACSDLEGAVDTEQDLDGDAEL